MVNGCHSLALRSSRIRSTIRYGYVQKGTPTRMAAFVRPENSAAITTSFWRGSRTRTTTRTRTKRPAKPKAPVTYQVSEQSSTRVQEEEFAKQLRLARYLAAGGSPPSRSIEPVPEARTPKRAQPIAKATDKTKAGTVSKKAREEELAKERRRPGRVGHKVPAAGTGRGEKPRPGLGR
jgi:hypothetical protein